MSAVSVVTTTITCDGPDCTTTETAPTQRADLRATLARRGWTRRHSPEGGRQVDYCPTCAPKAPPGATRGGRPHKHVIAARQEPTP